jgi:hypothetical protein
VGSAAIALHGDREAAANFDIRRFDKQLPGWVVAHGNAIVFGPYDDREVCLKLARVFNQDEDPATGDVFSKPFDFDK